MKYTNTFTLYVQCKMLERSYALNILQGYDDLIYSTNRHLIKKLIELASIIYGQA